MTIKNFAIEQETGPKDPEEGRFGRSVEDSRIQRVDVLALLLVCFVIINFRNISTFQAASTFLLLHRSDVRRDTSSLTAPVSAQKDY